MGCYCIPIVSNKIEKIPDIMESIGLPIVKKETQTDGEYYFCQHPKRHRTVWKFWITPDSEGGPHLFKCGLSKFSRQVVNSLAVTGLFAREVHAQEVQAEHAAGPFFPG